VKLLVTGATGFIGGAIARAALSRGFSVGAVYRGTRPQGPSAIDWRTLEAWQSASEGVDAVVHAAALRHRHGIAPGDYTRTNSELTGRMLALARARGAGRFVDISSIAVYGWPKVGPIDESFPLAPVGEYGRSKIECEQLVRASGLPYSIVQPSITYGPGDTNGMMDKILRMVARRRFIMPGLGHSRVQLIYIEDLARLVVDAAISERTRNQTFICTYRDPIRIRDLSRLAARAVRSWVPPVGPPVALLRLGALGFELLERRGLLKGEPPLTREKLATVSIDRCYRIDRMRELLGTEPHMGYQEGFACTAQALGLA